MVNRSGVKRQWPKGDGVRSCIVCGTPLCVEQGEAVCHREGCAKHRDHQASS